MTGRIHMKNMAFYGYHGHHPEETARGQRFLVDVALTLDMTAAAASDRLSDTIDYSRVYEACRKILETLCDRLLTAVMRECERAIRVEITIKKPSAPIPGVLDYVAIEASRDRVPGAGK